LRTRPAGQLAHESAARSMRCGSRPRRATTGGWAFPRGRISALTASCRERPGLCPQETLFRVRCGPRSCARLGNKANQVSRCWAGGSSGQPCRILHFSWMSVRPTNSGDWRRCRLVLVVQWLTRPDSDPPSAPSSGRPAISQRICSRAASTHWRYV
jgi:hypothetical protein